MERSRVSLWALGFMTVVAAGAFLAMLFFVDPKFASSATFVIFYLVFFVAVMGIVAWIFLLARGRFTRIRRPLTFFFGDAVRQGAIVSALLTISLYLEERNQLRLPIIAVLVLAAFIVEMAAVRRGRIT